MAFNVPDAYNLSSSGTNIYDYQEALYNHFLNTSTKWGTILDETNVTTPAQGDGSFSFAIENTDGSLQLNFLNAGADADNPDVNDARVGINPDGDTDPIVDSTAPSGDVTNFGDTNEGPIAFHTTGSENTEFLLFEWDDAILVLFKSDIRDDTPFGFHAGKIVVPAYTTDETLQGDAIMDGTGVMGYIPQVNLSTGANSWASTSTVNSIIRMGIGQSSGTQTDSWCTDTTTSTNSATGLTEASLQVGPSALLRPSPIPIFYGTLDALYGYAKYLRYVPNTLDPLNKWENSAGEDQYMCFENSPVGCSLATLIPDGFVINP